MQITIKVGTVKSRILTTLPEEIRDDLYDQLAYRVDSYQFMDAYNTWLPVYKRDEEGRVVKDEQGKPIVVDRERKWDGYKRLFRPKRQTFETGLLPRVLHILRGWKGVEVHLKDTRPSYGKPDPIPLRDITLRGFQEEVVKKMIEKKRLRIEAPPRSGKTVCAMAFYSKRPIGGMLFIVETLDLVVQTKRAFRKHLPTIDIGMIADGEATIGEDVTVATIQSVSRALSIDYKLKKGEKKEKEATRERKVRIRKFVSEARIVVIDEAHHAAANTYVDLLKRVYNAEYIIGMSGTPHREDNTELLIESVLGPLDFKVTRKDLIAKGYLVPIKIRFYKIPPTDSPTEYYSSIYASNVVHYALRNHIIGEATSKLTSRNKSVVITVSQKNHGKIIQKVLASKDVPSTILYGEASKEKRKEVLKKLNEKEILVVISTLLDEGVDIPTLDSVIVAAGDQSAIKVLQRMRCMTPAPGKTHGHVVDFLDQAKYLKDHSKKRLRTLQREPAFDNIDIVDLTDA